MTGTEQQWLSATQYLIEPRIVNRAEDMWPESLWTWKIPKLSKD
jgi:hypothetical protein